MNAPHIHLMLNHLPVIGLALGLLILLVGLLKKNATVLVVAMSITAVAGISSYPTMYSGGASEDYLEEHEQEFQIDHDLIHEHEEAAEIALKSNMQQKHGAVIVYKNKIIATGYNEICDYMNNNFSIHAEVSAISKMFYNKKLLEFCDIYVVRIAPPIFDNCLKNSKPCKNCTNFIKKYNLRNIYYSTSYKFEEILI